MPVLVRAEHLRTNFDKSANNRSAGMARVTACGNIRKLGTEPFDRLLRQVSVATVVLNLHPFQTRPLSGYPCQSIWPASAVSNSFWPSKTTPMTVLVLLNTWVLGSSSF